MVYANELGIKMVPGGALILTAKNCEILLKQKKALCEWKQQGDPSFKIPAAILADKKTCSKIGIGKYKISIVDCLPEFAKIHQNKPLARSGPNCWGTSMCFQGLFSKPRFMWNNEMMYWITSPLCHKLKPEEPPQPGDVVLFFGPENIAAKDNPAVTLVSDKFWDALFPKRNTPYSNMGDDFTGYHGLMHSEIYLTPELSFGKDSPTNDDLFYFHPFSESYARARVTKDEPENVECQENQTLEPYLREYQKPPQNISRSKCAYFSLVYRCQNIQNYFDRLSSEMNQENLDIWKHVLSLQKMQDDLFPLIVSHAKVLDAQEKTLLLALAHQAEKSALAEMKIVKNDKTREMLLVMQYFTAAAISRTINLWKN